MNKIMCKELDFNNSKLSFKGTLKQNRRLAEVSLKAFQDEFNFHVKSSTRLQTQIDAHKDNLRYEKLMPKLKRLLSFYSEDIASFKHNFNNSMHIKNVDKIKDAIKASKVANCPYQSELVANYLKQAGANVKRLTMVIDDGKNPAFHIFPIIDLSPKANLKEVGTWGQNAVIADPWTNHSGNAMDVINYFLHDVFKVNPQKQKVSFFMTKEPF